MGNYGFHSGEGNAKTVKSGVGFLPNARVLYTKDFDTTYLRGKSAAYMSGIGIIRGEWIKTYSFREKVDQAVGFEELVPSNIPRGARLNVSLYFTCSGVNAATWAGSGVVWDIDYHVTSLLVSGTTVDRKYYTVGSGVYYNATDYANWEPLTQSGTTSVNLSGTMSKALITIPAINVEPNSILKAVVFRDVSETNDNIEQEVHLICAKLEYVR